MSTLPVPASPAPHGMPSSEEATVNGYLKMIVARAKRMAGKGGLEDRLKIAERALAQEAALPRMAREVLAEALAPKLRELAGRIESSAPCATFGLDQARRLDLLLAAFIEPLGEVGADYAAEIRERVDQRAELSTSPSDLESWFNWGDDIELGLPVYTVILAWVLWHDVVASKMRGVRVPAISRDVLNKATGAYWSPGRRVSGQGGIVSPQGRSLAQFSTPMDPLHAERLIKAGPRLTSHRLFRYIVSEIHWQTAAGIREPRRIVVPHGLFELAGNLGMDSSKTSPELRDALELFESAQLKLPHGETGGILARQVTPPAPGRLARVDIDVSSALLANYVIRLPKGTAEQQLARRLVPIPRELPQLIGSPALHGAQATLHLLLLREFRDDAESFANNGFVRIDTARWAELASEAGLPKARIGEVLDAWTNAHDGEAPMLVRTHGNAEDFGLGEAYQAERDLLIEAAEMSSRGRDRQARSHKSRMAGKSRSRRKAGDEP